MKKCFLAFLSFAILSYSAYSQGQNNLQVIAYYAGGAAQLDSFDAKKITEIIFSFGHLQGNRFYLRSATDTATIQKMVELKTINPGLKVLLSLGGWGGCQTCSEVFATRKGRKEFAASFNDINDYFHTDGIDLDWEYPAVAGFPGHKYAPEDKQHFTKLVKALRKRLGKKSEISFAAGVSQRFLDSAVEWKKVLRKADRVNLMTYDLAGAGSGITNHHTNLFSTTKQPRSADYAVQYLLRLGVDPSKIVIGGAFYGKFWDAVPDTANGLYQPGKFTGSVPYKKMDSTFSVQNGFVYNWDDEAKAPYLYNASKKIFVSYDDKHSIELKTKYVVDKKLNGIMFWQLAQDVYSNGLLDAIDSVKKSYSNLSSFNK